MGGLERGGQELRIDRAKPRARLRPERQSGDGAEVHDTPIYFSERSRLRTDSAWPSRTRSFGVRPPKFEFGVLSHSSGLAKNLPASARRSESSSGRSALPAVAMTTDRRIRARAGGPVGAGAASRRSRNGAGLSAPRPDVTRALRR